MRSPRRQGWHGLTVALVTLVPACCAKRPDSSAAPSASASASVSVAPVRPAIAVASVSVAPIVSAAPRAASSSGWVRVPQEYLSGGPIVSHPSLPLLGVQEGDRCAVWSLDTGLLRGDVTMSACQRWRPSSPPVPSAVAARIAGVPDASPPADLLSAWSADRQRVVVGREGGHQVQVWAPASSAPLHTLDLPSKPSGEPPSRELARLAGLVWQASGEILIAGLPFGTLSWTPGEEAPPVPEAGDQNTPFVSVSLDPAGRYITYGLEQQAQRGDVMSRVDLVSLTGEKLTWTGSLWHQRGDLVRGPLGLSPLDWPATSQVAYAVRQRDFETTDRGAWSVEVRALDVRRHREARIERPTSKYLCVAPSPEGSLFAWVVEAWEPSWEMLPGSDDPSTTTLQVLRWTPAGQLDVAWSTPSRAEVIAWAPGSKSLAVVDDGKVTAHDAASGKVKGQWDGHAPLAWSPAGDQLAYADASGALVVVRPGAPPSKPLMDGEHAVTWGGKVLAAASDTAVTFFATDSWSPVRTVAIADVTRIVSDPTRDRWLFIDSHHHVYLDDAGKIEHLTSTVPEVTVNLMPTGDVLLVEPSRQVEGAPTDKVTLPRLRRLHRTETGWIEQPMVLEMGETIDPSGRFAVRQGGFQARLRRLSDGEVLHVDSRGAWTDRYAQDGDLDHTYDPWVFRKGDPVKGTIVHGAEAAALAPRVPDLWAKFWSGKPLPGL